MPRIDECLGSQWEAKYFSKIDLIIKYLQICLDEDATPKTAFKTKYGLFELTVLAFALTNASGFFLSTINKIFSDLRDEIMIVYLDDILM